MTTQQVSYTVVVHEEGGDGFWAEVQELPGCFASGITLEELWESLAEAVGVYLSSDEATVQVKIADIQPPTRREIVEEHRVETLCL